MITVKTDSGTGFEIPPPGAGFDTLTGAHPIVVSADWGTVAVSSVLLE